MVYMARFVTLVEQGATADSRTVLWVLVFNTTYVYVSSTQTCLLSRFWRRIYAFRTVCMLVRVDLSKLRYFGGQVNVSELIV